MPLTIAAVATERRYLLALGAVLVVTVTAITALGGWFGYHSALDRRSADLRQNTALRAQMLDTVRRSSGAEGTRADGAVAEHLRATFERFGGFDDTGETELLRPTGDRATVLFAHHHPGNGARDDALLRAAAARANAGGPSSVIARTADGRPILLASSPVGDSGLVLVERIDVAEFTAPLLRTAVSSVIAAALLVVAALVAFRLLGGRILAGTQARAKAFADVFDHLQDGVLIRDRSGRIRLANQPLCQRLGYPREALLRLSVSDIIPGRSEEQLRELHRRVHDGERPRHEVEHQRRDGTRYPVEVQLSPLRLGGEELLIVVARDVSEQRAMSARIEASERRFRTLFETVSDAMFLFAPTDGHIRMVNPGACALLGHDEFALAAMRVDELILDVASDRLRALWSRVAAGESAWRDGRMGCRDGRQVLVEVRLDRVEVDGETLVLALARDVTEREATRARLRRLNTELERRVRERTGALERVNQELDAFNDALAHDLRAPLRALAAAVEELDGEHADALSAAGRNAMARIGACRARLDQLLGGMIALTRASRGELEPMPVDLAAIARTEIEELRAGAPGRDVAITIADALPVEADPRLMRSVLHNLLANAWKFTAEREQAHIELTGVRDGDTLKCTISDDGVGFAPRYAGQLFEPMRRLHPAGRFEGTGIGLSTVRRIIHRHGGRVWAEGVPDGGARFHFELPLGDVA